MKKFIVRDNMSKNVLTTKWAEPLQKAYEKMKNKNIRHLIVTDEHGYLRGVISDRDFQRAMHLQNDLLFREEGKTGFDPGAIVRDYMSWPAETVNSGVSLKVAAQEMLEKKISALVITDDDLDAIGIITDEDLIRILIQLLSEDLTIKKKIENAFYNSPIGSTIDLLKNIGI